MKAKYITVTALSFEFKQMKEQLTFVAPNKSQT